MAIELALANPRTRYRGGFQARPYCLPPIVLGRAAMCPYGPVAGADAGCEGVPSPAQQVSC